MVHRSTSLALSLALWSSLVYADVTVLPASGQPTKSGTSLTFEIVGDSGASGQQMFLGTNNKVYIVDKTENNPLRVKGHPAWATEITLDTGKVRAMDVVSNSFCAGGAVLGDGTWINVGGNQAITTNGVAPPGTHFPAEYDPGPYKDYDGGPAIRLLKPCDNSTCNWVDDKKNYMTSHRWYPTLEIMGDGAAFIFGGDTMGGYVNNADQNNPTYEFFPPKGDPVYSQILEDTLPANLFALTWLLPSGNLFIQSNWKTELLNVTTNKETYLDDVPHAVRVYPASAASVMLPLTPANNYEPTILMCGGSNIKPTGWNPDRHVIIDIPADRSCVRISPDSDDKTWHDDTKLPEGRTMGNFILLPDGTIWLGNGAVMGTAGYGYQDWSIDESYADQPILAPLIYYPSNATFSRAGLGNSTVPRMYHSSAILLPDGSVFISGSNPHVDYKVDTTYPTEYRTERFYPWYYEMRRPEPNGLLSQLSYGGDYFNVTLSHDDMQGDPNTYAPLTKAVVIRTGFSTHAMNMGQKYLELGSSYTINLDGTVTLHVQQMPPNANLFQPGPAMIHIVVNGVPSVGQMIMVGSGKIEKQTLTAAATLPSSGTESNPSSTGAPGKTGNPGNHGKGAASPRCGAVSVFGLGTMVTAAMVGAGAGAAMLF